MSARYRPGDVVVYRTQKNSMHPGPHAQNIQPALHGDSYSYSVEKFWRVVVVHPDDALLVRTRKPAWWNVISICIPFLGLLCALGFLCLLASSDALAQMCGVGHPAAVAAAALFFWLGFGVLGLVAAGIALVRAERLWGITLAGFLLNGSLGLVFLLSDGGWADSLVVRMKFGFLAGAALLFVGFWTRRKKSPTTPM